MPSLIYRINTFLSCVLSSVPVGTNLGLFWLFWALVSGRFLLSRGGSHVRDNGGIRVRS